ncbi:hypothetical protein [Desulfovibrio gilichinskyi]|uniref:EamA-like transporter family protein n=1 Tax=Desulfovibrio gilichinskyi TaxID=1519643 RepID=A0A1X7CX32_9BACT|nr:hypothetical protein [Desulfovibrio gilichinskyi]SMF04729.1 hypothetical protein SAMN06295933_1376 [Desulfovibrio gilichinskyi]
MLAVYGSIAIVVASSVTYHLAQKSISGGSSLFASLASAYAMAMLLSLVGMYFQTGRIDITEIFSTRNWQVLLLGLAIFGIEVGVLLTYRAGASISTLPIIVNGVVMACLIPLGMLLYREHLTINSVIGIILIASGMWVLCVSGHA